MKKPKYRIQVWVGYGSVSFDVIAPNNKIICTAYSEYGARKIVRALNAETEGP